MPKGPLSGSISSKRRFVYVNKYFPIQLVLHGYPLLGICSICQLSILLDWLQLNYLMAPPLLPHFNKRVGLAIVVWCQVLCCRSTCCWGFHKIYSHGFLLIQRYVFFFLFEHVIATSLHLLFCVSLFLSGWHNLHFTIN